MGWRVDALASQQHTAEHVLAVWQHLPPERRGVFVAERGAALAAQRAGITWARDSRRLRRSTGRVLVASFGDRQRLRGRPFIMVEHGAGQTYNAAPDPDWTEVEPSVCRCRMDLMLCPSERVAARNRAHHPHCRSVAVGPPRLDRWHGRVPPDGPFTVAFTWHWDSPLAPETTSGWGHWRAAVERFVKVEAPRRGWRVLGHAHPRLWPKLRVWWQRLGVECSPWPDDVFGRAHVLVADNTSLLWEACAVGLPVVLLDQPRYRHEVEHGLRFWEFADAGPRVGSGRSGELADAVRAVEAADAWGVRRGEAARFVFDDLADGNAGVRAAQAIEALHTL